VVEAPPAVVVAPPSVVVLASVDSVAVVSAAASVVVTSLSSPLSSPPQAAPTSATAATMAPTRHARVVCMWLLSPSENWTRDSGPVGVWSVTYAPHAGHDKDRMAFPLLSVL
jgi:hypothetical protein